MKSVIEFVNNQEAIIASINNFIEEFEKNYQSCSKKITDVMQKSYQLMFRKYYYCSFLEESNITPANIVDKFVSNKFGESVFVIPRVRMKNKKNGTLTYSFSVVTKKNHHVMDDIVTFTEVVKDSIELDEYGQIPLENKAKIFSKKLFLEDGQYINYIFDLCNELGITKLVEVESKGNMIKTSSFATNFMDMEPELKLKRIVSATYDLCSKNVQNNSKLFKGILTRRYIDNLFSENFKFENFYDEILKESGINVSELSEEADEGDVAITYSGLAILDINLISIFGYYLGVVNPVTPNLYSMYEELQIIAGSIDDYRSVRFGISAIYNDVYINSFGGSLLGNKKRNGSKQVLPNKMGNKAFCEIIKESKKILEHELEESEVFKEYEEFEELINNNFGKNIEESPLNGKVITLPKKGVTYVLKVKEFCNKRKWKEVKIGFNDSMDHLNVKIQEAYNLSFEHLYSFFMSNKAWDSNSEYSHPNADGRSAEKAIVGSFDLKKKDKFLYIFDYGDEQKFEVEVKDIEIMND